MDSRNCDKYNTKTKEYKKISYTRSGKRVSYCRSLKENGIKISPCKQYGDDYEKLKEEIKGEQQPIVEKEIILPNYENR